MFCHGSHQTVQLCIVDGESEQRGQGLYYRHIGQKTVAGHASGGDGYVFEGIELAEGVNTGFRRDADVVAAGFCLETVDYGTRILRSREYAMVVLGDESYAVTFQPRIGIAWPEGPEQSFEQAMTAGVDL
jgi:hypothetical protein